MPVTETESRGSVSKQKNSEAERARLRRNQRNSRARRAAYVSELEKRWSECVQTGAVETSGELQREARILREENTALRGLLKEKGVAEEVVNNVVQVALDRLQKLSADVSPRAREVFTGVTEDSPRGPSGSPGIQVAESATKDVGTIVRNVQSQAIRTWNSAIEEDTSDRGIPVISTSSINEKSRHDDATGDHVHPQRPIKEGPLQVLAQTLPGLSSSSWDDGDDTVARNNTLYDVDENGEWDLRMPSV